jgi:hypothetical protein
VSAVSARKQYLVDLNPKWIVRDDGHRCGIRFDCPEGHRECWHTIPFTPSLEGTAVASWYSSGAQWQRTGDTFETLTLTLSPSIRREPVYASRDAALAAGCLPEHIEDTHLCALHIFIVVGRIDFCGDSR